jgi:diguanylate cyclase (GGDEF)-like protein
MLPFSQLLKRLGNPLDWTPVERGILLMCIVTPLYIQILVWDWIVTHVDSLHAYASEDAIQSKMPASMGCAVGSLTLVIIGFFVRRKPLAQAIYPHLAAQFYAISMCFFGYISGSFSFVSGVVMAGAPIIGFIIFERRVIYPAYAVATSLIVGTTYLSATGMLPYGPIFRNNLPEGAGSLFWVNSMIFFSFGQLGTLIWLADAVITRWKQREMEVKTLSLIDALTNISNRRHITQYLEQEVARARRHLLPVSLVILDVDHFKRINDTWGHPAGDRVLQMVAAELVDVVRQHDAVGRYGGEEFMLVLATDASGARTLAERCRQRLETMPIVLASGERISMTASFGVCTLGAGIDDADVMIRLADKALYQAKGSGRNRVETAGLPVALH